MKKSTMLIFVISMFLVASCGMFEGPEGPQGEQGDKVSKENRALREIRVQLVHKENKDPKVILDLLAQQGPQGEKGDPGESNVRLYTFPGHDYGSSASYYVSIPEIGPQVDAHLFFVYLVDTSVDVKYPIPGQGISGNSTYRVWWLRIGSTVSVRTQRSAGPGENYGQVRVITIPITQTPGGRLNAPEVDFDNYDEVVRYYGL
jgi:hypothetical protein